MANKKINQLVSKTSILSTDLFGIGDATTGQLFKKTIAELQAAIGGAVISVNGLVGTVVLDTDDIQELATPTNKYFTDARARGAISLTVTGNSGASTYSSGTGVLNVPTYTLAGLGGITASFLSGTSGISYNSTTGVISYSGTVYTDSSIRALLSGGTGITYNSSTGAISYSGTVYTDSSVRALISLTTTGSSGASTYNNTTGVINVPNYTLAGLGGISLTSLSGGTGITYNNTTGAISYSGTVYTDASVRALISASGNISYNSTTGVISTSLTQYTDALARASVSLTTTGTSGASTYNSTTGVFNIPQYASALSGTTNYHAKFTSSTTIGNSLIYDDGTSIGIGTSSPNALLAIGGANQLLGASFANYGNLIIFSTDSHAINKGGALSLGGKYNSSGTPIATFARIHGKKENTTVDSTAGYLSFETTPEATAILSEAMRISSIGNVSIGTNAPSAKFHVTGSAVNNGVVRFENNVNQGDVNHGILNLVNTASYASGNDASIMFSAKDSAGTMHPRASIGMKVSSSATSGDLVFNTRNDSTYAERMRLYAGGELRLGSTTNSITTGGFDGGGVYSEISGNSTATRNYRIQCINDAGNAYSNIRINGGESTLTFQTNGNERLRVTSDGNILMGTTSNNGERLYVSGSIRATGSITANSDISLKKNLLKIENALEKVEQINGYTYELKSDDSKRHGGVIAQEIDKVFPEIVNTGNDGLMGVEYGNISALLIEAIKEQQTQIKELKALLNK